MSERGSGRTSQQLREMLHELQPRDVVYYVCVSRNAAIYTADLLRHLDRNARLLVRINRHTFVVDALPAKIIFVFPDVSPQRGEPATRVIFDHEASLGREYDEWVRLARKGDSHE